MNGSAERRVAIIYYDRAHHPMHTVIARISSEVDSGHTIMSRVKEFWPGSAYMVEVIVRPGLQPIARFTIDEMGAFN